MPQKTIAETEFTGFKMEKIKRRDAHPHAAHGFQRWPQTGIFVEGKLVGVEGGHICADEFIGVKYYGEESNRAYTMEGCTIPSLNGNIPSKVVKFK